VLPVTASALPARPPPLSPVAMPAQPRPPGPAALSRPALSLQGIAAASAAPPVAARVAARPR